MRHAARLGIPAALLSATLLFGARAVTAAEPDAPLLAIADTGSVAAAAAQTGQATSESPAVVEDQGMADVREVALEMSRRMGALRGCYERELRHHPTLAGAIELRFTVAGNGTVRRARLGRDELRSRSLGRCLVAHLEGARFPVPASGPLQLAWPLRFRPGL